MNAMIKGSCHAQIHVFFLDTWGRIEQSTQRRGEAIESVIPQHLWGMASGIPTDTKILKSLGMKGCGI